MCAESLQQRQQGAPSSSSLKLSSDELTAVIEEASRLQGESMKRDALTPLKSVDDALALAEELGIPEEHVRAALASRQRRQLPVSGGTSKKLLVAGFAGVLSAVGLKLLGWSLFPALVVAALIAGGVLAVGAIAAAMKKYPAQAEAAPPVPGTCRVCFQPAYTPQSTFCDEHRYKAPGGAG